MPLVAAAVCLAFAACRGGGTDPFATANSKTTQASPSGATVTTLDCPTPKSLPFAVGAQTFSNPKAAAAAQAAGEANHVLNDFIGHPGDAQILTGIATYRPGIYINPLPNEYVSLWAPPETTGQSWRMLGRQKTDTNGNFSFTIPKADAFSVGSHRVYAVVEGDKSCAEGGVFVYPAGTEFVITDLDGTMTSDNQQLLTQLGDLSYVPKENVDADKLMRDWASKGYVISYTTARPYHLRNLSRVWLDNLHFPFGQLQTANSFVFGQAARNYKSAYFKHLIDDLGYKVIVVYGNEESDAQAYADVHIPLDHTFIIGPYAGVDGTTGISAAGPDNTYSYTQHIADFVQSFPDATQPF